MFAAGIDGGGTSARLEVRDIDGQRLFRQNFGPLNITAMGKDAYAERLREIFHACGDMNKCASLCVGGAGVSKTETGEILRSELKAAGFHGLLKLCGDQEIALRGAMEGPGGILIAGTGSIAYGINEKGTKFRVGGYGHIIDDPGSGFAIGRDALSLTVRALDGRIKPGNLTETVMKTIGVKNAEEIVDFVYASGKEKSGPASLAPLVIDLAGNGDSCSQEILERNAEDLAVMVKTLIQKMAIPVPRIAFAGGLLMSDSYYRNLAASKLSEYAEICVPEHDPLYGAVSIAMDELRINQSL